MPVNVASNITGPYYPDGAAVDFPFDFKATDADEVFALDQDGTTVPSSLYSVSLDDDEGGTLSFDVAPELADYSELYVAHLPALTQPSDFSNTGPSFNPLGITRAFDRAAARDLRQQAEIDRAIKLPFGEASASVLASAADRANTLFGFDGSGGVDLFTGTALAAYITPFLSSTFKGDPGSPGEGYATRAALALAGDAATDLDDAYLTEGRRSGKFIFSSNDLSAEVAADTLQGIFIAPYSDPTGASGAWVRDFLGIGVADWFGADPDFNTGTNTGTDNKAAIEAALDLCGACVLRTGSVGAPARYGVSSKVSIGANQHLIVEGTPAGTRIYPTSGFSDDAVIDMNATRSFATRVQVEVPTSIYDPVANTGTQISCFKTSGVVYHQHLTDCRAVGGYRQLWVTAFETKVTNFVAENGYDGAYIEQNDCSLTTFKTNNSTRYGLYTSKGVEGKDVHLVRSGEANMYLAGGLPIMLQGVYIDTPKKDGIVFDNTNGATLLGIFFIKMGEQRALSTDHDCRYLVFKKSRHNYLVGGAIQVQNDGSTIDTTAHYFLSIDEGITISNEYERSIGNTLVNFRTNGIVIAKDATQRKYAQWQKWRNCHNTAGRYNNEGLVFRSDQEVIAASGTTTLKFYIDDIDRAAAGRLAGLRGEWIGRTGTGNRAAGELFIPLAQNGDTGSKDGVVKTPDYSVGTAPSITIAPATATVSTNGSRNTMYVELVVTNTSASSGTFAFSFRSPLDNQGPD